MNTQDVKSDLEKKFAGVALKLVRDSILIEKPADLPRIAEYLKSSPVYQLNYLSSVTGSDFIDYLECVYHLYSMEHKNGCLVLRVRVKKENPIIPSLVPIFRGAEYQEREAYDMYGIQFENHPDLRRIFMWEGFEGFPMRKDYEQEDSEVLESADVEWLDKHNISVPAELRNKAEELKKAGKRAVADKSGKEQG